VSVFDPVARNDEYLNVELRTVIQGWAVIRARHESKRILHSSCWSISRPREHFQNQTTDHAYSPSKPFTMCTFTLELKLCPCKQGRPAQGTQKCVRKSKPFEKYIAPNDTRHALDVQDGIGSVKEYTCARERRKNGQHAEASMLCPDMKWAHGSQQGSRDMVQSTPCKDCLAGCVQAWG